MSDGWTERPEKVEPCRHSWHVLLGSDFVRHVPRKGEHGPARRYLIEVKVCVECAGIKVTVNRHGHGIVAERVL